MASLPAQQQKPPPELPVLPRIEDDVSDVTGTLLAPLPPIDQVPGPMPARVRPKRKVVIIRDEPSWYFDRFAESVKEELSEIAADSYDLEFEEFQGKGNPARLTAKLENALNAPETDLVLTAGYVSTNRAMRLTPVQRNRPVLGGAVEFSNLLESSISPEGTSKIPNYSFITNPQRIAADIEALRDISGETTIYGIVDRSLLVASGRINEITKERRIVESRYGVDIVILGVDDSVDRILAQIPPSAKAIYTAILPAVPPDERARLFEALARRGHITMSMIGLPDVKLGAMAGLAPDNSTTIAKRAAFNAHQILLGIDPRVLPVYLPVEDRLVINRASADLAGWSPNYEIALTAEFLNEDGRESGETLTLEKSMKLAAKCNIDIKIQKEEEVISRTDLFKAESLKRPTVTLAVEQSVTDYTDRINPFLTPDYLIAGSYGLELRQSLYNNTINSNIGSALENVAAQKLNTRSEQLDAIEAAGVAFLNYLAARSLWKIQKENLRLTENNLQLAKLRVKIGAVEAAETYRWEQDAASSRAAVFQAEADRDNARIELNRIMGQPREKLWRFEDVELADKETYFMDDAMIRHIRNENDARRFADFLRKIAVPASPELASFDFGLSAQGIELSRVERSFFLPEVAGIISYDRVGQGTEVFDYTTQSEALAGISVSLNLYEGGFRKAERGGQKAVIRQLAAQRERALQLIEQRALTSFNGIASEFPNIRLSRRGLEAAEKNYDAVREKYSKGAATILSLLDAQAALLQQRQQASLAVYTYLQQVIQMQRSIAWFEYEKNATQKKQWAGMLSTYMDREMLIMPKSTKPDPNQEVMEQRAQVIVASATHCPTKPKPEPSATAKPAAIQAEPVIAEVVEEQPPPEQRSGLLKRLFTNPNR